MKSYSAVAFASFVSSVAAHGYVTSPQPRLPGPGLAAACGQQVFNNQNSDHFGNIQGSIQNMQGPEPNCKIWQCKGIPFSDHAQVYSYTAGQVIPMTVDIHAPHSGTANVSIVKTSTDSVIGTALKSWDQYALTSEPMSEHPDWTSFSVTMPDVSSECGTPGDCVIQWWWNAASIDQTYEACIDFTMGSGSGSGSGSSSGSSSSANSTTPAEPVPSKTTTPTTTTSPAAVAAGSPKASKPAESKPTTGASTPAYSASPEPSSTYGQGGSSTMPKTFTIDTFIAWLRKNAGSDASSKVKRSSAAERAHPRAFAL